MRVCPPTSITSSMSFGPTSASAITCSTMSSVRCTSPRVSSSSSSREKRCSMLSGCPCGVMVMNGIEKGASVRAERSILVRSERLRTRCIATGSPVR